MAILWIKLFLSWAFWGSCDRSTPPDPLSDKSHVHSHWYCHLLCNHSLWYVHVLCEQSGESASHLSSHSSIFYLCLCRLHWGSLPILPNPLFSLSLVGNINFSIASSSQLKIVILLVIFQKNLFWPFTPLVNFLLSSPFRTLNESFVGKYWQM